jgi:putative ABC transport system permease protein
VLTERGPANTNFAKVSELIAGMAIIVLLIAGANVVNLLLARVLSRGSEIAVRLALGANRRRMLSEILTESVLLAALGGLVGLAIAETGGSVLQSTLLPPGAQSSSIIGDPRTLMFAIVAALGVGILTGLLPASEAVRVDPVRYLTAGRHGEARRVSWARGTLLLIQGGLSVVLLVGAGLFVRSLTNARQMHLGYDPARVLSVEINMRGLTLDSAQEVALRQRLLAAAQRVPDVDHAALNFMLPFNGRPLYNFRVPGMDSAKQANFYRFYVDAVSPDYFATMGTHIIQGRGIQLGDVAGAPGAVVVSHAIANFVWPGKNPIGQCVTVGFSQPQPKACTYVVGVAEDIKYTQLSDDPGFYYYLSDAQFANAGGLGLVVRVRGEPSRERDVIRRALQQEMPGDSYVTVTPLTEIIAQQTHAWQLGATMFTIFGLLALALAAIGLYAVISYTIERRTREIGVRIALGARAGSVLWIGVRQGLLLAGLGTGIGILVALALARSFASLLFNESPRDPLVYLTAAGLILAVAAVASIIPALRAARLDPSVTLRSE